MNTNNHIKVINYRPIILVSNSSWYLFHYRKLLIKEIKKAKHYLLALAPYDSSSIKLSKLLIHIPWRMSRTNEQNIYSFFISSLRMILLIRAIKPKLIHSHTLQANLISTIASFLFGINCVLSFAGVGRFSSSKGLSRILFILIFKLIYLLSNYQRQSRYKYIPSKKRVVFIFQNQCDIDFIKNQICKIEESSFHLIPGSGVPNVYINKSEKFKKLSSWLNSNKSKLANKFTFIYCARLLRNKGILIFIELSKLYPNSKFLIYGSIDLSSNDSLSNKDILRLKNLKNIYFMNNKENPLLQKNHPYPILVVPSIYGEGFPRGIIEANTLSIPVIASSDSAKKIEIKELLYISENNNIKSYQKCIEKIVTDYKTGKISTKINNARRKAINNFSEEIIVKKTLKIYDSFSGEINKSYIFKKDKNKLKNWVAQ